MKDCNNVMNDIERLKSIDSVSKDASKNPVSNLSSFWLIAMTVM